MGVRWYLAYPLSYRHVEALMAECGVRLDHATIQRWVVQYSSLLAEALHRRKRPVWVSWGLAETDIRVKGQWRYLYRTVDKDGQTIDFLLTEQATLTGIELMHMIKKKPMVIEARDEGLTAAELFDALAA